LAGGLVGQASNLTVTNSYVNISLVNEALWGRVGGLIGITLDKLTLKNSYANGHITNIGSGYNFTGGLLGYIESNMLKFIENCFSNITINHYGYFFAGNIYGNMSGGMTVFNNVHRFSEIQIMYSSNKTFTLEVATPIDDENTFINTNSNFVLNQESFYLETMNWSPLIWNLSNLDFLSGVLPILSPQI
jgi:hypothetical protein